MDIVYTIAGFVVGTIVGLTGVGGGALMTPFLVLYGVPPAIAVGTDLLYAATTKSGAVWLHGRNHTVRWRIVGLLALGSLPASAVSILTLSRAGGRQEALITTTLGVSLVLTSLVLLFRERLHRFGAQRWPAARRLFRRRTALLTVLAGIVLGTLVTLSSVGAGALGAAVLIVLYRRLPAVTIVGTDLAHALPLALLAGLGHLHLGTVDFTLLGSLLLGSLPGIALGTRIGIHLPEIHMRRALAMMLLAVGIGFTI
ncbi:MAG: sulfite exporter TauE/SafE family protein [Gammaproteobacteria bacterium]